MITCSRLGRLGQLGNQLFQVALLLGVSARTGQRVMIPRGGREKKRDLVELDCLELDLPTLWMRDRAQLVHRFEYEPLLFNPAVFSQPDNTDFIGYFQSEKYFEHAADEVRRQFRFIAPIQRAAEALVAAWREPGRPLVAIHVRRGDYLEHPHNFTVLSAEYLWRARRHFPAHSKFLLFSDDLPWCLDHVPNATPVRAASYQQELAAMTLCDGHIISASSFGWWGAWLSPRTQLVVAPTPWFPGTANIDTRDVVPGRWHQEPVAPP